MSNAFLKLIMLFATFSVAMSPHELSANDLIKTGERVAVAKSQMTVKPQRDWNKLSQRVGKKAETWTLDGERLNDISFFANIAPGEPLLRERSKKHDPLPKLQPNSLLTDIPEFLEGTYRSYHGLAVFDLGPSSPAKFMGEPAVRFSYEYVTPDELTRKGEAIATLRNGSLFMITFDAPKLHYFERNIEDYRALVATATMN